MKSSPIAAILIVACAVAGTIAAAAEKDGATAPVSANLRAILDQIQHHYNVTGSSSARFREEITPVGAAHRVRQGTVYFRKPGRMRWEFSSPEAQTIVSDGERVFSYEPDLNQVVESPLKQALKSNSAVGFLLGIGNIRRDFDAALPKAPPGDGRVHVMLKPKAGGGRYEVVLDPATYDILGFTMTDQLGDVTALTFSEIRDNPKLDDSLFAFRAPQGADIVTAPEPPH